MRTHTHTTRERNRACCVVLAWHVECRTGWRQLGDAGVPVREGDVFVQPPDAELLEAEGVRRLSGEHVEALAPPPVGACRCGAHAGGCVLAELCGRCNPC